MGGQMQKDPICYHCCMGRLVDGGEYVHAEECCSYPAIHERERDTLRAENERLKAKLGAERKNYEWLREDNYKTIIAFNVECSTSRNLTRQLAEAEEQLKYNDKEYGPDYVDKLQQDIDERNVLLAQKQKTIDELREALDFMEPEDYMPEESVTPTDEETNKCHTTVKDAVGIMSDRLKSGEAKSVLEPIPSIVKSTLPLSPDERFLPSDNPDEDIVEHGPKLTAMGDTAIKDSERPNTPTTSAGREQPASTPAHDSSKPHDPTDCGTSDDDIRAERIKRGEILKAWAKESMERVTLKPCPACGGISLHGGSCRVLCDDCGLAGPIGVKRGDGDVKWNAMPRKVASKVSFNGQSLDDIFGSISENAVLADAVRTLIKQGKLRRLEYAADTNDYDWYFVTSDNDLIEAAKE